jgi:hypothetical protein
MNIPEIRDIGQGNSGWLLPHPYHPLFQLCSYPCDSPYTKWNVSSTHTKKNLLCCFEGLFSISNLTSPEQCACKKCSGTMCCIDGIRNGWRHIDSGYHNPCRNWHAIYQVGVHKWEQETIRGSDSHRHEWQLSPFPSHTNWPWGSWTLQPK